ncbi:hypothetical protein BDV26DRAFT_305154 [Aspergillus bertholletiae]|uniref:Uncharacterized protein n=1 Tax=Aspergillus bertholletiae TaxID=1226010 RepID=A0A5N7B6J6_9EURO|nr:hypothetical protein BDV26DRAFT_305154 [Aspergillus bertholletiae]
MAHNQPATNILRVVSDYLYQCSESPQYLEAVSDSIKSLSDAIYKVKASSMHTLHSPAEFTEKLMHTIDWRECRPVHIDYRDIMTNWRQTHMHGELFPRFIDDFTEEYCDSFGSDLHLYEEWQEPGEFRVSLYDPQDELPTIQDLSGEISQHLQKTQINKGRTPLDKNYHFSPFLSLSADFRWTGLAIFDTSKMHEIKVRVWRVSDLLLFLDSKPRFEGSIISELSRNGRAPHKMFLRRSFRESKSLAHFKTFTIEELSANDYYNLLSDFLEGLLDHVSPLINGEPLVDLLIDQLADYRQWGYSLTTDRLSLRRKLGWLVNTEYAFGLESWIWDSNCERHWKETCWNLSEFYDERAERIMPEYS